MATPPWVPSLLRSLLVLGALYLFAADLVFGLRHPELTDTQRFLRTGEALLWR